MTGYGGYVVKRALQLLFVVFAGISATFFITHLSPIDPVEQTVTSVTAFGQSSPEAVEEMRRSLTELYGTNQPMVVQYVNFWRKLLTGDLGPSLSAFPTPVSQLIMQAVPWTLGLLLIATIVSWAIGNVLGGLAGYYPRSRLLNAFGVVAMGVQPIPYYIVALILLILFGSVWPILPISGGYAMDVQAGWTLDFVLSVLRYGTLPALSLVVVGLGTWFLGMRSLVSNVVSEDYVTYAELAGVDRGRILRSYVMRNAMIPQITGLAMSLGGIFSGTVVTEQVFSYPGLGKLLVSAVNLGDYSLVLGVGSVSIFFVALAVFVVDLIYPILDPRMKAA